MGSLVIQERLNQLVALFKGRTERQKERLVDPDESEEESPSACTDQPLPLQFSLPVPIGVIS